MFYETIRFVDDYMPDMSRLPHYLLRLACDVNWKEEQPCFEGICRETASFYSFGNLFDDVGIKFLYLIFTFNLLKVILN